MTDQPAPHAVSSDFTAKVQERQRAIADQARERGGAMHVYINATVAEPLRREAARLALRPHVVAQALLARALAEEGPAIGREEARRLSGSPGRDAHGLTLLQCALIHAVGENRGGDGWCRIGAKRLAALVGRGVESVSTSTTVLEAQGYLVRGHKWGAGSTWRLTFLGEGVYAETSGGLEP